MAVLVIHLLLREKARSKAGETEHGGQSLPFFLLEAFTDLKGFFLFAFTAVQ